MKHKRINVCLYARDTFSENYLKNLLKTDPHITLVDQPEMADVIVLQVDLLSTTERKILEALTQHGTIAKVAAALRYSPATVKSRLSRIYAKLRVKTAPQAIAFAMKYGLIQWKE